jgi:hypothetical protein
MSSDPKTDPALKDTALAWLTETHAQFARGARDAYAQRGRGCFVVEANRRPGTARAEYLSADELPTETGNDVIEVLRGMVEEYDPKTQFVISLVLEGEQYGLQAKVRLDRPVFIDNASDAVN